jgi:hypothetical protein
MKAARQSLAADQLKVHLELAGRYFDAFGSGTGLSASVCR